MKTKKISKKLNLSKRTVSNLNNEELSRVNGGGTIPCYTDDCPTTSCTGGDYTVCTCHTV